MLAEWTYIRSTRATPPGLAAEDERRRRDYVAALTQFEQMYTAAATVGAASKPILLYYGLSQAGRALLAARKPGQWQAHGHGLKAPASGMDILARQVRSSGEGLFQAVSRELGSDPPSDGVQLGALWHALPDVPAVSNEWLSSIGVPMTTSGTSTFLTPPVNVPANTIDASFGFGPPRIDLPMPAGVKTLEEAAELLQYYPAVAGAEVHPGMAWNMTSSPFYVALRWKGDAGEYRHVPTSTIGFWYPDGGRRVVPSLGGVAMPFLMIWWMLLYAMSMLARYEPATWVGALNVDRSSIAVPLEAALERPTEVIPQLVKDELELLYNSP
jgi:YaaC-like Protein